MLQCGMCMRYSTRNRSTHARRYPPWKQSNPDVRHLSSIPPPDSPFVSPAYPSCFALVDSAQHNHCIRSKAHRTRSRPHRPLPHAVEKAPTSAYVETLVLSCRHALWLAAAAESPARKLLLDPALDCKSRPPDTWAGMSHGLGAGNPDAYLSP